MTGLVGSSEPGGWRLSPKIGAGVRRLERMVPRVSVAFVVRRQLQQRGRVCGAIVARRWAGLRAGHVRPRVRCPPQGILLTSARLMNRRSDCTSGFFFREERRTG